MKKYRVQPGSQRWKYFIRRVERISKCRDTLADAQERRADIPPELRLPPGKWPLPDGTSAAGRAVRAVLAPLMDPPDVATAATIAALGSAAEAASADERDWLACLAGPWARETDAVVGPLMEPLGRLRTVLDRIEWCQAQGLDVILAILQLEEANLVEAEAALAEQESLRRASERRKSLSHQIGSLHQSIAEEDDETFERLRSELDAIGRELSDDNVEGAYERFHAVSRQVEQARRQRNIAELEEIRDAFQRLGSRPNHAELALVIDDLHAQPDRPIPVHLLPEVSGRLEQVREEVEGRARRIRDEIRNRIEAVRQDLEATVLTAVETQLDASDRAMQADDPLNAETEAQRARDILDRYVVVDWTARDGEPALLSHLIAFIREFTGFSERDIRRVHVALKTRRFVVFSGLTGSGKSTIARLFAEAFHATSDNGRFVRVAVRPNWVDESEVLGYINPMTNRFEPGWMATLMRACEREPNLPFFCLLDEMNLAPVEQYLADILSAMEEAYVSRAPVPVQLYSPGAQPANIDDWPAAIPFPGNLFLFGTVNIDESTRGLSDRVLDRANVIQLSVKIGREHHAARPRDRRVSRRRVRMREWLEICAPQGSDQHHDLLVEVADVFRDMRIGLGVRSHLEMERFLTNATGVLDLDDALDLALLQRAVPKIRGFKRELAGGLQRLRDIAERNGADRTVAVLDGWLHESISDDAYLDGTDANVGLVTSY